MPNKAYLVESKLFIIIKFREVIFFLYSLNRLQARKHERTHEKWNFRKIEIE